MGWKEWGAEWDGRSEGLSGMEGVGDWMGWKEWGAEWDGRSRGLSGMEGGAEWQRSCSLPAGTAPSR